MKKNKLLSQYRSYKDSFMLLISRAHLLENPHKALSLLKQSMDNDDKEAIKFYLSCARHLCNLRRAASNGDRALVAHLLPVLQLPDPDCERYDITNELSYNDYSGIAAAVLVPKQCSFVPSDSKARGFIQDIINFYTPQQECNAEYARLCQKRRLAMIAYGKAYALQNYLLENHNPYITSKAIELARAHNQSLVPKLDAERKKQLETKENDYHLLRQFNCISEFFGYHDQVATPAISNKLPGSFGFFSWAMCPKS